LLIAIWATLAGVLLPDGLLRTSMFLLASTTWIATLLINASPFLRFDGYFLMMDWLDMPNLHARAFALGRWRLREWLFGLEVPPPEQMGPRRQRLLIFFAYATWGYRLLVFGGIAVIVYQAFPKPLGPVLAAIEVSWFIILPVLHEMKIWREYLRNLLRTRPGQRTLGVLVCLLLVVIVPWDTRVEGQGVLKPLESYPLIAPGGARISTMPVSNGAAVPAQALLLILEQVDLQFQHRALAARSAGLSWQVSAAGVDAKLREQQQVIAAKREKVDAEQQGLEKQQRQFVMRAPFAGTFYLTDPDLVAGNWVGKNEKLGELVGSAGLRVETYLAEADIDRLRVGDQGVFYPEPGSPGSLKLVVNNIDTDATHELTEGMLASNRGGGLAMREHAKALVPEQALYRVVLSVRAGETPVHLPVLRGRVVIHGRAQNSLLRYVRAGLAVLWREAGF
ncbi:MAG: HlyD family efflux transporter periplasmic adaptor subunit, partial [Burkholderiales bacterium]